MSNPNESFSEYIKQQHINKGQEHTHTRIGDKISKISGGSYNIEDEKIFLDKYFQHVFINGNKEYLTEKQRIEDAPLVVDIDMRYSCDITERQHTKEHIIDLVDMYARNLSKICDIQHDHKLEVFVMEKPTVNILEDKTKDGIHIIFGISMHKAVQVLLREKILPELKEIWEDLPLVNDVDDLLDEGVTRGIVNWQLYGSRKPNHSAYLIKYNFELSWNNDKDIWEMAEINIDHFSTKKNLHKLSVHCTTFPVVAVKDSFVSDIDKIKESLNKKKKSSKLVMKKSTNTSIDNITNMEKLDAFVAEMLEKIEETPMDYELKETHDFTMILPRSYWGAGSYSKWIRVGWALKNSNTKLLATWLKFCSQSDEFSFGDISDLVEKWNRFDYNNPEGLTARSIMYWAKNDNPIEYKKVRSATISHYMEITVTNATDWDFAHVLYQMYKDEFVCVSIKNNVWYEYRKHRWYEIDSGNTLRSMISKKMHDMYMKKVTDIMDTLQKMDQSDDKYESLRKRANKISDLCVLLKKTNWKNNIMKESKELFYDNDFINKMDQNPYLICFENYVIDFKNKIHRPGQPDDYISKSTNISYIPLDEITDVESMDEVKLFIEQLFPDEELRAYMWEHLASTLIGNNDNQTFNIYTGSGANGKSKLVDLMSKMLGSYKATVPITLVTQKRNQIGSTSSEIVQLMGVRYAVMQEPSRGESINEGIMKEITGGDPIQGRALFKEAVTFIPQFKLVVCTNHLFEIKSNDDGTWRRIRICDFMSKFLETPYGDEHNYPKDDYPYQYDMDKKIDEKFSRWAPVLASMLVDITYKKMGAVKDCNIVMGSSSQYREGQDYLAEFCKEKIKKVPGGKIKKTELWTEFKQWYNINNGKNIPKARELNEHMDKKYGKYKGKWSNIAIIYEDDDEDSD